MTPSRRENRTVPAALLVLCLSAAGAVALTGVLTGQPKKPAAPMQVEKVKENLYVFKSGLSGYYDEMKAQLSK
jgi:hypothetical protein